MGNMKLDVKGTRSTMGNSIAIFFITGVIVLTAILPALAQDADPISILKSDASLEVKEEACRQLSIHGTQEAVPVLTALLVDEELSHMARYALEPMPYPEAGQALRDALGTTSGRLKVGVINSLAIRKDEQAVPELTKLLSDSDAMIMQAAAVSLGQIANAEAQKALEDAIAQANSPRGNLNALCDGLLGCAEKLALKQQPKEAIRLYDLVLQAPNATPQVRSAAMRGAVLNRNTEEALPLLMAQLGRKDADDFSGALRVARELSGNQDVTAALAGFLPAAPLERKILILGVFGEDDGDAAGAAVLAEAADGDAGVRAAALRALTRMHYSPALDLMARLAWTEEGELAAAARNSLAYFVGEDGDAALDTLLRNRDPKARLVAVELIGQGGLDNPGPMLLKTAESDSDESVRVAALEGLFNYAGIEEMQGLLDKLLHSSSQAEAHAAENALIALSERQKRMPGGIIIQEAVYGKLPEGPSADVLEQVRRIVAGGSPSVVASNANFGDPAPGLVKQLRIDYTENGTPISKTVSEGQTLKFADGIAPAVIVDAYCGTLGQAQGEARIAVLRILGSTGSPKAFELVSAEAASGDGVVKDTALRTLCNWPTRDALPTLLELAGTSSQQEVKMLALTGAVRLLNANAASPQETLNQYAALMGLASTPEEKKLVLSGVAQLRDVDALTLALAQFDDEAVKAEAIQAAIAIANGIGASPTEDSTFFNGIDLTGWQGNLKYWRVEDGSIVGQSTEPLDQNEFLWSGVNVSDFYLVLDVLLEPNTGNAGIQFRSRKADEQGQALGYQADIGQDMWGRLYHEHGRGKLDWTDAAEKAVKPGEWNRYEILAVGPAIWTAINGKLGVSFIDQEGQDERSGLIAVQVHAGPPLTARYRIQKLVHNPKIEMEGLNAKDLISALRVAEK